MSTQDQPIDCFVCRKHRGEIVLPGGAVYQDDVLYVGHIQFQEGQTTYLGYLMIEPKRHLCPATRALLVNIGDSILMNGLMHLMGGHRK